jgi:tetratricopeptide (TPR) repeat protein
MVMEDPVVRKALLNSIIASLCAVGAAVTTAEGSPVDMLLWKRSSATPPAPSTPAGVPPAMVQAGPPSAQILYRNPIKYLGAAISEMPLPGRSKQGKTVAAKPKAKHDSIGLDTPTGPPSPQLMISMAQMCERSGDTAGARHHYQQALAMWPGQVDVLRAAARMEDRLGGLALAESLYQQAVAANPQTPGRTMTRPLLSAAGQAGAVDPSARTSGLLTARQAAVSQQCCHGAR